MGLLPFFCFVPFPHNLWIPHVGGLFVSFYLSIWFLFNKITCSGFLSLCFFLEGLPLLGSSLLSLYWGILMVFSSKTCFYWFGSSWFYETLFGNLWRRWWCLIVLQTHLIVAHQLRLSWNYTRLSSFQYPFSSLLSFCCCFICFTCGEEELIGRRWGWEPHT